MMDGSEKKIRKNKKTTQSNQEEVRKVVYKDVASGSTFNCFCSGGIGGKERRRSRHLWLGHQVASQANRK